MWNPIEYDGPADRWPRVETQAPDTGASASTDIQIMQLPPVMSPPEEEAVVMTTSNRGPASSGVKRTILRFNGFDVGGVEVVILDSNESTGKRLRVIIEQLLQLPQKITHFAILTLLFFSWLTWHW